MLRNGAATAVAAAAALAAPAPVTAAPGDMQYVGIDEHDPRALLRAMRAGSDFVKSGPDRRFQIILSNRGVILVIPGTSTVQRDIAKLKAPGLAVVACRETLQALQQANKRRIPVIPGVTVEACKGKRNKLNVSGWQAAPGL